MTLLDHFRPPISEHHRWESFHSNCATRIADALNEVLPDDFLAEEQTHSGRLEIDIATYEISDAGRAPENGGVALVEPTTWGTPTATIQDRWTPHQRDCSLMSEPWPFGSKRISEKDANRLVLRLKGQRLPHSNDLSSRRICRNGPI